MSQPLPYIVADDAIPPLLSYCQEQGLARFFLVADSNTYQVLGERTEAALRSAGIDVKTILLTGHEIATNEYFIVRTLMETNAEDRQFIAVGSGTVTDITRFVSHRTRAKFISLPTAPSVDGYTSIVAPTEVGKYKVPIVTHPPQAVFADLPTLCAAPRRMIAAGLGDLLGKYTSLADWRIGQLLYDEPYSASIAQYMRESVDRTVEVIDSIASASCEGITRLMDGLVGAGFGMLEFGDSRPASGSEHHIGHYWEMKLIIENRPALLHGAEVGVATIFAARRFARLRQISQAEAAGLLKARQMPTVDQMLAEIQQGYGPVADRIQAIQAPLLNMTAADLERLKSRILDSWDEIQAAAAQVPAPEQIESWLAAVDGPTTPSMLNLSEAETRLALNTAHYLRDRFTINRLFFWLFGQID
jgi:glycerol-1-phosphate dehydrogenase [NAD(P)+]